MKIEIRQTKAAEFETTLHLTRETFWNLFKPGCDEHLVLYKLRKSDSYIPKLDLVAIAEQGIVGHSITTRAKVIDNMGHEHEVLCVGPVSVLPEWQNKGIGGKLLTDSISIARSSGFAGMILFGHPAYYRRFGFVNAQAYGITTKDGLNFEPFMALELNADAFRTVKGRFYEDKAFEINEEELNEFETYFPPKEKGKPKIEITH
ncbi:MAG: N-acetyltransferase [Bacteroidetes bacterium]|nr:N-acetyltransferase [Bacteroidota bacterium]